MSYEQSQDLPPKVLRIKRKRGQDPLQALILEDTRSVKRSKPSTPISSPGRPSTPINYLTKANDSATTPTSKREPSNQALQRQKQIENSNYLFKLSTTEDDLKNYNDNETILSSILSEATSPSKSSELKQNDQLSTQNDSTNKKTPFKRRFVIQQPQKRSIPEDYGKEIGLSNEVSSMINDYVTNENDSNVRRKKRGGKTIAQPVQTIDSSESKLSTNSSSSIPANEDQQVQDEEDDTYVYDVYHLIDSEPLTTANHPKTEIGYIRFFDDLEENNPDSILMNNIDEENDDINSNLKKTNLLTDDEDSNAESFYQNDYPSDEDLEGLEELNEFEDGFNKLKIGDDDDGEDRDYDDDDYQGYEPQDGIGFKGDEYFDYGDVEKYMNLQDEEDEEGDDEDDEPLKRNTFFKSDVDDPLAIHRDKIFGKLEKMINE
ncbi:uncharacterized protein KGF55_004318 [Candida pseudojiufengensis]|uniref:uncharacterized protein n=1 Tax=Candida pseudojiufengensis TaxID=497109 RepID=UPI002224F99C|nr:uncharacterized protein KGF55_004318 [Candida pseudojiufengensis]KAI5960748.1 hypothetical protein KGF55_004318 [Candida pseudojiufengensis]